VAKQTSFDDAWALWIRRQGYAEEVHERMLSGGGTFEEAEVALRIERAFTDNADDENIFYDYDAFYASE
jgi:hypothetical protein